MQPIVHVAAVFLLAHSTILASDAHVPPRARMEVRSGAQTQTASSYCWPGGHDQPGTCADSPPPSGASSYLRVGRNHVVRFRILFEHPPKDLVLDVYRPGDPSAPSGRADSLATLMTTTRSASWRVPVEPARYLLVLSAHWGPGMEAAWDFGIEVDGGVSRTLPNTGRLETRRAPILVATGLLLLVAGAFVRRSCQLTSGNGIASQPVLLEQPQPRWRA